MKLPTQEDVQNAIMNKVADWLTEESKKIWGENFLKEGEKVDSKLKSHGYEIEYKNLGMTISYILRKDNKKISYLNINVLSLVMDMAKNSTL